MNRVLLVEGVRVWGHTAIRTLQRLVLIGRVVAGHAHTEGGVTILLSKLAELFHAERLASEVGGRSLYLFHDLGTLGVGRSVGYQIVKRLREGKRTRDSVCVCVCVCVCVL